MSKSCMSNPNMTFCWLEGKVISHVTARCQLTRKREESLCCCFFQWELIRSVLLSTVNQDNELGLNHHYKRFWRLDWHWGSLHQCCVSVNPLIVLLRCRNGKMCVYTEWTVYLRTRIRSLSNHPDADGKIPKTRERDLPISAYLGVKLLPRSLCDTQRSDLCWSCSHKCLRTELLWGCSEPFLTPGLTNAFSSAL